MNSLAACLVFMASLIATDMKVTAYSNDPISINVPEYRDGLTATHEVARRGLCAADWNLYPVGTQFWIPNYGVCTVEDRGGAVRGEHIDLFFATRKEALEWGVQNIQVYIIVGGMQ